ncbi:hypothetical protein DCN31_004902, partial [Salmonella enterica subsp. enterica serovar 4,[5],12:i:-]|nr:hypothetical protein [Salmonella enterica subsp. enterica serovar 4,[5],12:i:-]
MSPPHLLCDTFGSMGFVLYCRLIQCHLALYEIRVPRSGSLPPTSFRYAGHPAYPCLKLRLLLPSPFGTCTLEPAPMPGTQQKKSLRIRRDFSTNYNFSLNFNDAPT